MNGSRCGEAYEASSDKKAMRRQRRQSKEGKILVNLGLHHGEYLLLQDVARFVLLTCRWVKADSMLGRCADFERWIETPIRWRPALGLDVGVVLAPIMGREVYTGAIPY